MRLRFYNLIGLLAVLLACSPGCVANDDWRVKDRVDINRADVAELMRVPGMTESWAGRIVRFRPYFTKLDLVKEGVVPEIYYRRIRGAIIAHHIENETRTRSFPASASNRE